MIICYYAYHALGKIMTPDEFDIINPAMKELRNIKHHPVNMVAVALARLEKDNIEYFEVMYA